MRNIFRIAVPIFAILCLSLCVFSQNTPSRPRIIRAEKPYLVEDEEIKPAIRVVGLSIGNRSVELNSIFEAGNDWLKELNIRIKNISGARIYCVGVSFGLLAEIDTKLQPSESWPWGVGFYKGNCGLKGAPANLAKFTLEPGGETVLTYRDVPAIYSSTSEKVGKLAKAVFHPKARVIFKRMKYVEAPLLFSQNTIFLDDDPY